nr:balbiani ring protein 3 [Hydra vulgaris]
MILKGLLIILVSFNSFSNATSLENVDCGSYVDYVDTDDQGHFRFLPRVVKLNRCRGVDNLIPNPHNYKCVPTQKGVKKIDLTVVKEQTHEFVTLAVENNTECQTVCSLNDKSCNSYQTFSNDNCECTCNYDKNFPVCNLNFVWSKTDCNCICSPSKSRNCPLGKQFNEDECDCKCSSSTCPNPNQVLDPISCNCLDKQKSPSTGRREEVKVCKNSISMFKFLIGLVIEAIFFILLFTLLYCFFFKPKLTVLSKQTVKLENSVNAYCNGLHATDV